MTATKGKRSRTRDLFSQAFRRNGVPSLSRYLTTFKRGDLVDIKADPSIQKGMPHKFYHGRTGTVWNVSKHSVGVEVNKLVGSRIIKKRIHVRIEHVKHSKCRLDFLNRVKQNDALRQAAKQKGELLDKSAFQRKPAQPKDGFIVKAKKSTIETMHPIPFEDLV